MQILNSSLFGIFQKLKAGLRGQDVYLKEPAKTPKSFLFSLIFLTGLFGLIFIGFLIDQDRRIKGRYEERLTGVIYNFEQAKSLVDLNPLRARELAVQAQEVAQKLASEDIKDKRLTKLVEEINLFLPEILGEYRVSPNLLLDLGLIQEGLRVGGVTSSEDGVVVLDTQNKILVGFRTDGKNVRVLAGPPDIPQAKFAALMAGVKNRVFVVDGQRIVEATEGIRTVVLSEGRWVDATLIGGYGGNLYVLDPGLGQIWRYLGAGDKFGPAEEWLEEEEYLTGVLSMAIDGSIWMLEEDGTIKRYIQGKRAAFLAKFTAKETSGAIQILTDGDKQNLYLLFPKRVVVLDKKGEYKAQYFWEGIEARWIAVSERLGKLLVFSESKVYEVELKM